MPGLSGREEGGVSDLIDRKAVIDSLSIYGDKKTLDEVYERIVKITTSHPKAGHWGTSTKNYFFVCSECDARIREQYNYCPNCGADMRGGKDEID